MCSSDLDILAAWREPLCIAVAVGTAGNAATAAGAVPASANLLIPQR